MYGTKVGCFSFSNDASLLLPSTAMTGTYRVAGANGASWNGQPAMPSYVAITGTKDGTNVDFKAAGKVVAGGGIGALSAGQSASFSLNAGDVIEVVGGSADFDNLSGSLVTANNPIQIITGVPCRNFPNNAAACDHIEESVFPAETLGKEYVVSVPASPKGGKAPGQAVHIVGNIDGTSLTFDPPISASGVSGGKATINAGQVMMLGVQKDDFHVVGDHEFIVLTFMLGGSVVDPNTPSPNQKGDPAQSLATAVEQYRDMYVFLAPQDYDVNFVNIMATSGTSAMLDGQEVAASQYSPVGGSGLMVARVQLAPTGTHQLTTNKPVGIQVYGYGSYTSYQYPGGLNLKSIAPPPPK